jgi:Tol biopolymer transport system component/DNA-binding winged helix-turn-helix (wHTH) protein
MAQRQQTSIVRFGTFELDTEAAVLRKNGIRVRLQEQPFRVLVALIEKQGGVVTREELQQKIWADTPYGDFDHSLNIAVNKIRQALGDSAETPRFVETLPRRGYRFLVPVSTVQGDIAAPEVRESPINNKGSVRLVIGSAAALGIIGGAAWFAWPDNPPKNNNPVVTPLTTYPGHQLQPSSSPDGTRVAFSWGGPEGTDLGIYVKLVGPGDPVRITKKPAEYYSPAWSPDGVYIAMFRDLTTKPAVLLVPASGGPERELTRIEVDEPAKGCGGGSNWGSACVGTVFGRGPSLSWSPDNKFLFTDAKPNADQPLAIMRINVETGEKQPITAPPRGISDDMHPAVSPDGRAVAFVRTTGSGTRDVWVMSLVAGAHARRLTNDGVDAGPPVWTEDGRELIFSSNREGRRELWRVAASGSAQPRRIDRVGENAFTIDISRRQHRLIYEQPHVSSNLWKLPLQSGAAGQPQRVTATTRSDTFPHYSPDQKRIAFQSHRSGVSEIWVCDGDGSNAMQVTSFGKGVSGSPRWSPDGRSIVFDSSAAGNFDIWVIGWQGGRPVRVTTNAADDIIPSWSHDGQWIYFSSKRTGRFEMWKIRPDGSSETELTTGGGYAGYESADGKYLYYKEGGDRPMWRIPVGGGVPVKVLDSANGRRFTPVEDGIYFAAGPRVTELRFLDFGTGQVKTIADLGPRANANAAISPDRRWLVFPRTEESNTNLMLTENFR